jgi:hypothetical protein
MVGKRIVIITSPERLAELQRWYVCCAGIWSPTPEALA